MGGPPKAARPPLWRRPKAASIMGEGGLANIEAYAKTIQNMFVFVFLPWINKPPWTILARGGLLIRSRGGLLIQGPGYIYEHSIYIYIYIFSYVLVKY